MSTEEDVRIERQDIDKIVFAAGIIRGLNPDEYKLVNELLELSDKLEILFQKEELR